MTADMVVAETASSDGASSDAANACDELIAAIEPLAIANGVEKVLLHGEHKNGSIEHMGMLLAVQDMADFTENAYSKIACKVMDGGMFGGVLAQPAERFPNGHEDMKAWYSETGARKSYEQKDGHLVPVG